MGVEGHESLAEGDARAPVTEPVEVALVGAVDDTEIPAADLLRILKTGGRGNHYVPPKDVPTVAAINLWSDYKAAGLDP